MSVTDVSRLTMRRYNLFVLLGLASLLCLLFLGNENYVKYIPLFFSQRFHKISLKWNSPACQSQLSSINRTELRLIEVPAKRQCRVLAYDYENWTQSEENFLGEKGCNLCTNDLFREVLRQNNAFPHNGSWIRHRSKSSSEVFQFQPNFCSFSEKELDPMYVRSCLKRKGIKKIVSLGDSNSRKYVEALVEIMSKVLDKCNVSAIETDAHKPNPSYYLGNISFNASDVTFADSLCHSCSRRFACSYETLERDGSRIARTLEIEQVGMTRIFDGSRRINKQIGDVPPTNFSQEFLLRDYLRLQRYPEILLIFIPFIHEVYSGLMLAPNTTWKIRTPLRNLLELVRKHVPTSTSVYWVTEQDIFGSDPLPLQRNKLISESTEVLFEVLKDDLTSGSTNMYSFLNIFELSCPLSWLHMARDPTHLKSAWYHAIAKYYLELHCNS